MSDMDDTLTPCERQTISQSRTALATRQEWKQAKFEEPECQFLLPDGPKVDASRQSGSATQNIRELAEFDLLLNKIQIGVLRLFVPNVQD